MFVLGTGQTEPIAGSDGAVGPFWSPDGRSIAFYADSKLKRVEIGGGAPQTITAVSEVRGAAWRPDGFIVFAPGSDTGLSRVPATGGRAEDLTTPDAASTETSHRWPFFLPDRRLMHLAMMRGTAAIYLRQPELRGSPKRLVEAASAPIHDSGHLLFVRDGALRAQSFDPASASLKGEPVTIAQGIASGWQWIGGIPVSAAFGVLAFRAGNLGDVRLTWIDRSGQPRGTLGTEGSYQDLALSPDGRRVAMNARADANMNFIGVLDLASGALQRLTFEKELNNGPCWSPDGRALAYSANRSGTYDIYLKPVSGTGAEQTLVHTGSSNSANDLSRDGRFLLYENRGAQSQLDLFTVVVNWVARLPK